MIDKKLIGRELQHCAAMRRALTTGEWDALPADERRQRLLAWIESSEQTLLAISEMVDLLNQQQELLAETERRFGPSDTPQPKPRPDHLKAVEDDDDD